MSGRVINRKDGRSAGGAKTHKAQLIGLVLGFLYIALVGATWLGLPLPVPLAALAALWVVALRGRAEVSVIIAAVVLTVVATLATATAVAGATVVPMRPAIYACLVVLGMTACVVISKRSESAFAEIPIHKWDVLLPFVGVTGWFVFTVLAEFKRDSLLLSWVMEGDAANNFIFMRDVIAQGGIQLGGLENPAPMTSIILAIFALAGREGIPVNLLTLHDLTAFAHMWAFAIGLLCLLSGLFTQALLNRVAAPLPLRLAATLFSTALPLSWFFTGYAVDYGFANSVILLIILLASANVAFVHSAARQNQLGSMTLQVLAGICAILTWSPTVIVPAAFWALSLYFDRLALFRYRASGWFLHAAAAIALVSFILFLALPSLLKQGSALSSPGAIFPLDWRPSFGLAIAVVAIAAVAYPRVTAREALVAYTAVVAALLPVLVLLANSSRAGLGWTYYPLKMLWVGTAFILLVGVALAFVACTLIFRHRRAAVFGVGASMLATTFFIGMAPAQGVGYIAKSPVEKIWRDLYFPGQGGDEAATLIASYDDPSRTLVLWRSGLTFEGFLNYWHLKLSLGTFEGRTEADNFVHTASYGVFDLQNVEVFCRLVNSVRLEPIVVVTSDLSNEVEFRSACDVGERQIIFQTDF